MPTPVPGGGHVFHRNDVAISVCSDSVPNRRWKPEAALGIVNDLPGMMEARRKIETKMEAIRQRHSKSIKH